MYIRGVGCIVMIIIKIIFSLVHKIITYLHIYFCDHKKLVEKYTLILFFIVYFQAIILHDIVGGVVLKQKISNGNYYFLFRRLPDEWVEVSSWIYWAEAVQPFIQIPTALIFLFVGYLKYSYMSKRGSE